MNPSIPSPVAFGPNVANARVCAGSLMITFLAPMDTGGPNEEWMTPPQQISFRGIHEAIKLRDFLTASIEFTQSTIPKPQ